MEIERLTIKNGEIGFYGDIYNKCSNKNDPKIKKQIELGKQYCDIKGYKYRQYSHKELSAIYKKLSLFEDIMEKHLIETPEMLDVRLSENSNVNKMFATKIADLEAKLAESESKAKTYAKEIVFLDKKLENLNKEFEFAQEHNEKTVEYWQNECSQLKQQLADKDAEIEGLKKEIRDELVDNNMAILELQQSQNQTAIAELEKVRHYAKHIQGGLIDYIDQQIKELKGVK